jgi:hypothetical protein
MIRFKLQIGKLGTGVHLWRLGTIVRQESRNGNVCARLLQIGPRIMAIRLTNPETLPCWRPRLSYLTASPAIPGFALFSEPR